jgi:hypothetical protein
MQKIVNGFIIEANKSGYFYHRTRSWVKYDKPEMAYVWTEEEVKKILESSVKNAKEWELKPGTLYPSTFYAPVAGKVEINNPSYSAKEFGSASIYKGGMYDRSNGKFTVTSEFVGSSVTL